MACRECITGSLHEGTPTGRVETIHGLPTYITEPPSGQAPKGIIIFIPDAVGWDFVNNRLLADKYAKGTNSRVYLPDFMNGSALGQELFPAMDTLLTKSTWTNTMMKVPAFFQVVVQFIPFLIKNRQSVAWPTITKWTHALRAHEGTSLPVGAAGFCWGGKYVFLLCHDAEKTADGKSLIECGFTAHPSNLVIPADAEGVKLPCSVSIGDVDFVMPVAQVNQMKEILEKKNADEGAKHEVVIIPGATHGFAVRGNPYEEKAIEHGRQAEVQAIDWFNKWFAKGT
ncbi:hypothetical protein MMC26_005884 [Xylographa opegraphella]|nr:hypothetical protein [Xylographa opegraphella]